MKPFTDKPRDGNYPFITQVAYSNSAKNTI